MTNIAIVSLLRSRNLGAVLAYLRQRPRIVVSNRFYISNEFVRHAQQLGSQVAALEDLVDGDARKALQNKAIGITGIIKERGQTFDWTQYGLEHSSPQDLVFEKLEQRLYEIIFTTEALNRIALHYPIEIMVVNDDVKAASKAAVLWAKNRGIPSLHLTHGLTISTPYTVHSKVMADKLAIFGERGAEPYLDLGIPPQRMAITGNPAWDGYAFVRKRRPDIRQQLGAKHGFSIDRPLVVFGTTWKADLTAFSNPHAYERSVSALFAACRELRAAGRSYVFVVKDRPPNAAFGADLTQQLASKAGIGPKDYVYDTGAAETWVTAADVVVSLDSNLSVEAILAGVPAVNLWDDTGILLGPSFGAEDAIVHCWPEELGKTLMRTIEDEKYRTQIINAQSTRIGHFNGANDGGAATRVAQLMQTMARMPVRSPLSK